MNSDEQMIPAIAPNHYQASNGFHPIGNNSNKHFDNKVFDMTTTSIQDMMPSERNHTERNVASCMMMSHMS